MRDRLFNASKLFLLATIMWPVSLFAASAPYKVVYTFGGLNERSGILWVARDAGIFRKYGIDPTIVNVRNAQVGMSALAGGETQFHVGSATGTSIGAMAGGLDLAYIAGLINKLDGAFMVNPSIKTPADLKGKKIGVQSIGGGVWMFSMLAFEHWGLNPERDNIQFRIIGDQSVLAQAITQNIIDGGYLGYAYGAQLERQGYRMLGDLGLAEDMVQNAWLRWSGRHAEVQSPRAYLVTLVTRLCINELDSARMRREESRGDRLPEPVDLDEGGIGRA